MFERGLPFPSRRSGWCGRRLLVSLPVVLMLAGCGKTNPDTSNPDVAWGLGKSRLAPAAPAGDVAGAPVAEAAQRSDSKAPAAAAVAAVVTPPPPPPPPPETMVERATRLAAAARLGGDILTAQALYRQVLTEQPQDLTAQLGLAHTLTDAGDLEAVRPMVNDLVRKYPQNDQVLALAARMDIVSGDLSAAAVRIALGVSLMPDSRDILQVQGMFEDMRGNHVAAQQAYGRILAATPGDIAVRNNMALSQMAAGDAVSVLPLLEPVVNAAPAASEVVPPASRHNLAMAYGLLGREDEARALLAGDLSEAAIESNLKYYRWLRARRLPETVLESARPVGGLSSPPVAPLRRN